MQAEFPPFAFVMCAPFVIKPVAVPPAGNSGLPTSPFEGLSGGKITVFPVLRAFYAEWPQPRNSETRRWRTAFSVPS
jgi:hypothetical protein